MGWREERREHRSGKYRLVKISELLLRFSTRSTHSSTGGFPGWWIGLCVHRVSGTPLLLVVVTFYRSLIFFCIVDDGFGRTVSAESFYVLGGDWRCCEKAGSIMYLPQVKVYVYHIQHYRIVYLQGHHRGRWWRFSNWIFSTTTTMLLVSETICWFMGNWPRRDLSVGVACWQRSRVLRLSRDNIAWQDGPPGGI